MSCLAKTKILCIIFKARILVMGSRYVRLNVTCYSVTPRKQKQTKQKLEIKTFHFPLGTALFLFPRATVSLARICAWLLLYMLLKHFSMCTFLRTHNVLHSARKTEPTQQKWLHCAVCVSSIKYLACFHYLLIELPTISRVFF